MVHRYNVSQPPKVMFRNSCTVNYLDWVASAVRKGNGGIFSKWCHNHNSHIAHRWEKWVAVNCQCPQFMMFSINILSSNIRFWQREAASGIWQKNAGELHKRMNVYSPSCRSYTIKWMMSFIKSLSFPCDIAQKVRSSSTCFWWMAIDSIVSRAGVSKGPAC